VDEEKIGQLMLPIRTARKFVALPPAKKTFHGRAALWGCGLCRGFFAWQVRFAALRQELGDQPRPSRLMVCADAASRVAVKKFVKQN
jgi:hypothetical protein